MTQPVSVPGESGLGGLETQAVADVIVPGQEGSLRQKVGAHP